MLHIRAIELTRLTLKWGDKTQTSNNIWLRFAVEAQTQDLRFLNSSIICLPI